jgi:hypothetical protein
MMPRWQRAYVIAVCAIIAGTFAYTACDWGKWPILTYHPMTGDVAMHANPGAITIGYLGVVAWGLGGAAVGAVVGAALCAVFKKAWSERTLHLFGAWAITGILLAGSYYTWNLFPW